MTKLQPLAGAELVPEQVEEYAIAAMEASNQYVIHLSENPELYDLSYIARNLARCSAYSEQLAELLAYLGQLKITVLQALDRAQNEEMMAIAVQEDEAESRDIKAVAAVARFAARKTLTEHKAFTAWVRADKVLNQTKVEVGRRVDTIRRLDSDLRLHEKIIEARITAGALGRPDLLGPPREPGAPEMVGTSPEPEEPGTGGFIVSD